MQMRRDMDKRLQRLSACARALSLPTLAGAGRIVRRSQSEEGAQNFLSLCPHSEYVNVTGAGHMVAGDRNDVFANAVIEFLTRTVPIGGPPKQPAHGPKPHHRGPPGDTFDVP